MICICMFICEVVCVIIGLLLLQLQLEVVDLLRIEEAGQFWRMRMHLHKDPGGT